MDEEEGDQLRKCACGGDHREAPTDKLVADNSKRLKMEQNRKSEQSQKTERTRRGKGRVGVAVKQKGMSTVQVSDGAGNCLSVEEQVASGSISKDKVSQIVVRMPNGSRVQKSFICHHPIEVRPALVNVKQYCCDATLKLKFNFTVSLVKSSATLVRAYLLVYEV